jgi:hypothetical protein
MRTTPQFYQFRPTKHFLDEAMQNDQQNQLPQLFFLIADNCGNDPAIRGARIATPQLYPPPLRGGRIIIIAEGVATLPQLRLPAEPELRQGLVRTPPHGIA